MSTKGISKTQGLTLHEIAARLNISPQRVGFLERQAMRKLRALIKKKGLKLEDLL